MNKKVEDFSHMPILLKPTRVWRTYIGGMLLEKWLGDENPGDNHFPEDWIASVTKAFNPGREEYAKEGLSEVIAKGIDPLTLKDLIEESPTSFLGEVHVKKHGINTGILIKLIDSAERLTIQVHPSKENALKFFNSKYGKTEAWHILGTREINNQKPYVLLGFKKGVTKEKWIKLFESQDIKGMEESLHKFYVKPGQTILIDAGVPHAIGPGCFLLEIQEPTDFTFRVERLTPSGFKLEEKSCHLGIGFDRMFECFDYSGFLEEEVLQKYFLEPSVVEEHKEWCEKVLIDYHHTPNFKMSSIDIYKSAVVENSPFSILLIFKGQGIIEWDYGSMMIKKGDRLFLPHSLKRIKISSLNQKELKIIKCMPPM